MSIQPIDLQTLFMRLSHVGKIQAAEREASHIAQTRQGAEMARRSGEQSEMVNQTRDLELGPEQVKDDERQNRQPAGRRHEDAADEQGEGDSTDKPKGTFFRDPALGNKIDITG